MIDSHERFTENTEQDKPLYKLKNGKLYEHKMRGQGGAYFEVPENELTPHQQEVAEGLRIEARKNELLSKAQKVAQAKLALVDAGSKVEQQEAEINDELLAINDYQAQLRERAEKAERMRVLQEILEDEMVGPTSVNADTDSRQEMPFDSNALEELHFQLEAEDQATPSESNPEPQMSFRPSDLPVELIYSAAKESRNEVARNRNIFRTALRPRTLVLGSATLALAGGGAAFAVNSSSEIPAVVNECFDESSEAAPLLSGDMAIQADVVWGLDGQTMDLKDAEGDPDPLQLTLESSIDYTVCLPESSDASAFSIDGGTITIDRDALALQAVSRADPTPGDKDLWQTLEAESFDQKTADTLLANMNDDTNETMAARIALAQIANEIENGTGTFSVTNDDGEAQEISAPATIIKTVEEAFTESIEAAYPNKTILYAGSFDSVDFVGTSAPQTDLFTIEASQIQQFSIETDEVEK